MADNPFTLSHSRHLPGSRVTFHDGRSIPLNCDEEFSELLLAYRASITSALAEIFPEPKALLALTGEGQFSVLSETTMPVHKHVSRLVETYCRAVQYLKTREDIPRFRQVRNESAALLQAYCSLGYLACRISAARNSNELATELRGKDAFTGIALIALASQDAPYVSRDAWETYVDEFIEAVKTEAKLPLEIRLKLDSIGPLPTEVVFQGRPRRRTALKAVLPWVTEFMKDALLNAALHRATVSLGADVVYSDEVCSLLTHELLWHTEVPVETFADGEAVLAQLQFPDKEGVSRTVMVVTESGNFRVESRVDNGKRIAVLRPHATYARDFMQMGIPAGLRAAMGI
jgi:hypothetical protein